MDRKERRALIESPALSGKTVVAVEVVDPSLPSFEVVNSDGSRIPFDMSGTTDFSALTALLRRLGIEALANTDDLVGLTYDGDGLIDAQREAASAARKAETKRVANGLHFSWSEGGSMGSHQTLMLDGKYVGHLYIDASEGIDPDQALVDISKRYNMHAALVAALESARAELGVYEAEASGEVYNDPELNALIDGAKSKP